jgi:uncharacterized protein
MFKSLRISLYAAIITMSVGEAHSASFDCKLASHRVEKLVCGDTPLSALDETMAVVYQRTVAKALDADALRREQRQWMSSVRSRCFDVSCLVDAYAVRIGQLVAITEPFATPAHEVAACVIVSDRASRHSLDSLIASGRQDRMPPKVLQQLLIAQLGYFSGGEYWKLDLDGDGVLDELVIAIEGTMRVGSAFARLGKHRSELATLSDETGLDLSVLNVRGKNYIASGFLQEVQVLWKLNDQSFVPICRFTPRAIPWITLEKGEQDPLCTASVEQRRYASFSRTHALGSTLGPDTDGRLWSKSPINGMERIDIDNDGQAENLVRLDFTHGGGRGCSATYLAVTDDARTIIPDIGINRLLLEQLGGVHCGPNLSAFTYEGTAFVEAVDQSNTGTRSVFEIRNGRAQERCKAVGHWLYDVDVVELVIGKR